MTALGLNSAAWVVVVQALSTYCAILSAYLFALPVLRGQNLQAQRDLHAKLEAADPALQNLISISGEILDAQAQSEQTRARTNNFWGAVMLGASFLLITAAIALQMYTDPMFKKLPTTEVQPKK